MVERCQRNVIFGHYLLVSGLLGGLISPILLFNLDFERRASFKTIVVYIPFCTQILGSVTIVFTTIALCINKSSWIYEKQTSVVLKVKVVVILVLGIMLCVLQQMNDYEYHSTRIFSKMVKNSTLAFVFFQTLFITWCSRFVFYETRKLKYIMSFLAVVNTVNWLDATVLTSIFITECNSTDIGKDTDPLDSKSDAVDHRIIYLLSFIMEFSIQATTFVIAIPMTKDRENTRIAIPCRNHQEHIAEMCRLVSLCRKQKVLVAVISFVLISPFLFYVAVLPTPMYNMVNYHDIWLFCIVSAKGFVFFLITIAYYVLYKNVTIRTVPVTLDFSDIALLLGTSAVTSAGVVTFLLRKDSGKFIIDFHTWFNILYSVYQTIFVLFLKFIVIRDKTLQILPRVRMIVIILVTYNMFYWVKDSLFFLPFIKVDVDDRLFKFLFFLLYPLISFYRFQSAMGMIPFLS